MRPGADERRPQSTRVAGTLGTMCMQCAAAAMTTGAAATGARAWLVARAPRWLTAGRKRALSAVAIGSAVLAAALIA
jgi:hypothetical protein